MKPIIGLMGALLLFQNAGATPTQSVTKRNFGGLSPVRAAPTWTRIRVVRLVTGTDNGGRLEVYSSHAARKIRVVVGLSNATVQDDFIFERKKLVLAETTRTYFAFGENGIDFNQPVLVQNWRYQFRNGREISRVTREKKARARWKYGVAPVDAMSAPQILGEARFFLKVAASPQSEVDVEKWIKHGV